VALDVWLLRHGEDAGSGELVAQLRWDGYFEYLRSYWPASSSNGKVVDLYDDAVFRGANLSQLRGCLERALRDLEARPKSWQERVGYQIHPQRQQMCSTVEKAKLSALIERLRNSVDRAVAEDKELLFFGD
jgi:hypothetical protein